MPGSVGGEIVADNLTAVVHTARHRVGASGEIEGREGATASQESMATVLAVRPVGADDLSGAIDAERNGPFRSRGVERGEGPLLEQKAVRATLVHVVADEAPEDVDAAGNGDAAAGDVDDRDRVRIGGLYRQPVGRQR